MKKITVIAMIFLVVTLLVGCNSAASSADEKTQGDTISSGESSEQSETADNEAESEITDYDNSESGSDNILVVYFSRTGENYGVGVIGKGNTAIVADIIAEETGATEFEIVPVNAYPESYDEMLTIARQESSEKALPEYQGDVENWDNYDTVFIGYPIWYGDMPRIVYTFLENHDWTGKTVIPFDTNAGSGLSETENEISDETGASVLNGLAVRGTDAQENQNAVIESVKSWIEELGL